MSTWRMLCLPARATFIKLRNKIFFKDSFVEQVYLPKNFVMIIGTRTGPNG